MKTNNIAYPNLRAEMGRERTLVGGAVATASPSGYRAERSANPGREAGALERVLAAVAQS